MAKVLCGIIMLALAMFFAYIMWRLVFSAYIKKIRVYVPDLVAQIKRKEHIDTRVLVMTLLWSVCVWYVAYAILKMCWQCILILIM